MLDHSPRAKVAGSEPFSPTSGVTDANFSALDYAVSRASSAVGATGIGESMRAAAPEMTPDQVRSLCAELGEGLRSLGIRYPVPRTPVAADVCAMAECFEGAVVRHAENLAARSVPGRSWVEIAPNGGGTGGPAVFDSRVFDPTDAWATTFRDALERLEVRPRSRVYEVGVGAGVNVVTLLVAHGKNLDVVYGSDIVPDATKVAADNVRRVTGLDAGKFVPRGGSVDLLGEAPRFEPPLDIVIACIPQVPWPDEASSSVKDPASHYYRPGTVEALTEADRYGLGANAKLLEQAASVLTPGTGRVVLNLAGRVPWEVIERAFEERGFEARKLSTAVVEQHRGTSLESLARLEDVHGVSFRFCGDPYCRGPVVSARLASERLEAGLPVYHELFVVEGRLRAESPPRAGGE